ncbi:KH domain-containing protein 3-like [Sorex araneus]|uniref:KH domain-containing protein 3-like n=1 Tax=Sorex araneus TaxID=42254 RepID=UPI0024337B45|nr:KH domain-containing protein 3-like [Sorex araneus]
MATSSQFPTLVQLEQREGAFFEVHGNLTKKPDWFLSDYLKSPKAVHLEGWMVEAIFGRGGKYIPHVVCTSQTLLHVNRWDPAGKAEILIFGRPYYQLDVSKMIWNLADCHHQLRAQRSQKTLVQETGARRSTNRFREAGTQRSPDALREAATQRSPDSLREAATQCSPDGLREAAIQRSPDELREAATQCSPDPLREAGTQRSPYSLQEAAIQRSPFSLREAGTQRSPDALREAAIQRSPDALRERAI